MLFRSHDDGEQLAVQLGPGFLRVQNIDDIGIVAAQDGDGHIHVVGGDIAFIAHQSGVVLGHGVPGGQKVGGLFPGQALLAGGAAEKAAGVAIQNEVVAAAVIDAQLAGVGLHQLLQLFGSVLMGGLGPQVRHEVPVILTEDVGHLLVKRVDIEAGDAGGQKGAHHCHQRCDEQQQDQHQLHVQAAEQGRSPLYVG